MIPLVYLVAAACRLAFSPIKTDYRLRVFMYRMIVAAFCVVVAVCAQALMLQVKGDVHIAALVAVVAVVAVGEHLIYGDLYRRQMLPANAPRLPLGF